MFLKYLIIENTSGLVRRIDFHQGLNLIVDETPSGNEETGNNVGKTTVLRLIDFCFGMDGSKIYSATEGTKVINEDVKNFLINTEVMITLCLTDGFSANAKDVIVRRNFLSGKRNLMEINGQKVDKKSFETELQKALWNVETSKPSFRQIISHNFRYDEERLTQTLRTLNRYTSDVEYETLHLYLFGCNFDDGDRRQELDKKLKTDYKYKRRLEKTASKSALRSKLAIVEGEIDELNKKKEELHLNPDFENDLEQLNKVKGSLSELAVKQSSLQLRHTLLPQIRDAISACNAEIASLRVKERMLAERLQQSASVEALDELVAQLNLKYQEKGSLEQRIAQIEEVEKAISLNEEILKDIDSGLFSQSKQDLIQKQLDKFNHYYSAVSKRLYDESYAIEFSLVKNREGKSCYKFAPFATDNFSTGKKQGEITCFDMAYIMFADDEQIPCLHFILNDRKELVHDNQLLQIGALASEHIEIQYVASILRDKLPAELNQEQNIVLKLSQHSKLFRIEE